MVKYIKSSYDEIANRVTWPTYKTLQNKVVVVAVFSVIFSLAISGVDYIVRGAIDLFFKFF